MPPNIKLVENRLAQTNPNFNVPSLVVLPIDYKKFFCTNNNNVVLTVSKLKRKSFIYIGLIEKSYAMQLNFIFPMQAPKSKPINKDKFK